MVSQKLGSSPQGTVDFLLVPSSGYKSCIPVAWPGQKAIEEFSEYYQTERFRELMYVYPSNPQDAKVAGEKLLDVVVAERKRNEREDASIVWVAEGFGAEIVKEALAIAQQCKEDDDRISEILLEKTYGMIEIDMRYTRQLFANLGLFMAQLVTTVPIGADALRRNVFGGHVQNTRTTVLVLSALAFSALVTIQHRYNQNKSSRFERAALVGGAVVGTVLSGTSAFKSRDITTLIMPLVISVALILSVVMDAIFREVQYRRGVVLRRKFEEWMVDACEVSSGPREMEIFTI